VQFSRVEIHRSLDLRYAMQLAEVSVSVPEGPLDASEMSAVADRFERRYAELYGEGSGFSAAGIQAITFRGAWRRCASVFTETA
jgi:N-methylhydantoinase A